MRNVMWRRVIMAAAGMAFLMAGACAGVPMKAYPGPALPADQTALIESGPYTYLVTVDGLKVPGLSAAVLPGKHTVEMIPNDQQPYRGYLVLSHVAGSAAVTAQAGHKYLAYVDFLHTRGAADEPGAGYVWIGYIRDKATGEKAARTAELPAEWYPMPYTGGGAGFSHR